MGIHPYWQFECEIDEKEVLKRRLDDRAYLARYGRQNMFDLNCSIPEIGAAVQAISKIVHDESVTTQGEDH